MEGMTASIRITGAGLRIEDLARLAADPRVQVSVAPASVAAAAKSKAFLDAALTERIIYGVNTGFGPMASHIISRKELTALQYNLVRSHAAGMGRPLDPSFVLAAMAVRLNTLAKGQSGVSTALLEHLTKLINLRITPVIPEHGGVGASGDLVQLAHIALALIGEGEVFWQGERMDAAQAMAECGLEPHELQPKEGLALINGTAVMTGIAALVCAHAQRLVSLAVRTGAWALELIRSFDDGISEPLHQVRPHPGQLMVAQALRDIVASSRLLRKRGPFQKRFRVTNDVHEIPEDVQEIYSFRCIPQVLGPVLDTLVHAHDQVTTEMNSVTDNPIIDADRKLFLHGGNFHGDYVAAAADRLKAALAKLTLMSERRVNFFLNNRINRRLPPFLNLKKPGLTLALQGLQFVATSTAAKSQSLAYPHHVHSISTNADNQDVVSMGTDAALFASQVVENAYVVLAIELTTLAQATDVIRRTNMLSEPSRRLYRAVRERLPTITDDRYLGDDLTMVVTFAKEDPTIPVRWYRRTETPGFQP